MAWYRTGTVTVTNGSTAVSGVLTAWSSNVRAGDFLFVGTAAPVEIAAVNSNTSITLAEAWPGGTASASYAIAQGTAWGDVTALAVQIAQLISSRTEILSGTGVPSNSLGSDGSVYFRIDQPEYYSKAAGAWGTAISLRGPAGTTGAGFSIASTTSTAIGIGSKSFAIASGGLSYIGARARIASASLPANYMEGVVQPSTTATSLVVTVDRVGGSGTFASWNIVTTGDPGSQGPAGSPSTGASSSPVAIGTGLKTFTVPAGLDLVTGQRVRFADTADPAGKWMDGAITSYIGTSMTISVPADDISTSGTGTISSWTFGLAGARGLTGPEGAQGLPGDPGAAGASYAATSTTSLTIGTGNKDFTTQAGLAYVVNASRARAADSTNPANYVEGPVTSYSGTALRIAADRIGGSGTVESWNISLVGEPGSGVNPRGAYSGATSYSPFDVVIDQGSSWINIASSTGVAPPTLPTLTNSNWVALAIKGEDGTGLVDSVNNVTPVTGNVTLTSDNIEVPATAENVTPASASTTAWLQALDKAAKKPLVYIYTSSGTHAKSADCLYVSVTAVGGGGGGGTPTAAASQVGLGASGAGGGTVHKTIDASLLAATETVTVGGGGPGGGSAGTNGTAGGTSSFGSHCSATGGGGGSTLAAGTSVGRVLGATGGIGSGGDLNLRGGSTDPSVRIDGSAAGGWSPCGGHSSMGAGARGASSSDGTDATGYGGGGSGAVTNSATQRFGGAGMSGIVIVTEFFN